jgi:hypothetical protein
MLNLAWLKIKLQMQAACCSPSPPRSAHFAAPAALRQGRDEHSPLTLLASAAFHAQRDGFGERRLSITRMFSCSFQWAFLIVAMSLSNCR